MSLYKNDLDRRLFAVGAGISVAGVLAAVFGWLWKKRSMPRRWHRWWE
jgi:hypothetical protein